MAIDMAVHSMNPIHHGVFFNHASSWFLIPTGSINQPSSNHHGYHYRHYLSITSYLGSPPFLSMNSYPPAFHEFLWQWWQFLAPFLSLPALTWAASPPCITWGSCWCGTRRSGWNVSVAMLERCSHRRVDVDDLGAMPKSGHLWGLRMLKTDWWWLI